MNRGNIALTLEKTLEYENSDKTLYVSNCGYFVAKNSAYTMNRSVISGYLLIYLHKGKAKIVAENCKDKIVEAGTVIIYKPLERPQITYLSDSINERYYVYFNGTKAEEYIKILNLHTNRYYLVHDLSSQIKNFNKIIQDFKIHPLGNELFRTTYLLNILTSISTVVNPIKHDEYPDVFKQILDTINENYSNKLSTSILANKFSLSVSTLKRYFKKYLGQSPMDYINNTRVEISKFMLVDSNLQISEIAYSVGFEDPLYFSKFFKKHTGLSPKAFRNETNK